MAGEWREVSLGELLKVKHGFAFKGEFFTDEPKQTVLVTPGNFAIGGGFQDEKRKYYSGPVPEDYVLSPGQIVVTMTDLSKQSDTLGYAARIPQDDNTWLHNQRVGLLVFNSEKPTEPRFFEYLLRTHDYRSWIVGSATGTTVKHTSPSRIESYKTRLPPLEEQRAIAHILGTFDDKIELNRRMNETLEAIARAIFKSWFVDFDPVRAKADGEPPESICRRLRLTPDLLALFPDRLVDSELGEIPEGWDVRTLGDIAENPRRGVQPNEIDATTPYIALEHMPRRCIALSDWGVADGLESNKFEFKSGEILFGKLRPYFHKVGVAPVNGVCSTDIVVIAPRPKILFGFVLGLVSSDAFVEHTNAGSTGTKMPRTSWKEMARYAVVQPSEVIAGVFTDQILIITERIIASIHESRTLASLRDALLPKLLSGELRVPDAEKAVEALT